jgi:hypothetical protein
MSCRTSDVPVLLIHGESAHHNEMMPPAATE